LNGRALRIEALFQRPNHYSRTYHFHWWRKKIFLHQIRDTWKNQLHM